METRNFWYCALIFGTFLFLFLWRRRKFYILSFQLPGPKGLPLIGNGFSFMCKSEELLSQLLKLTDSYPSPGRFWTGPHMVIFVKDPDQLQVLMQSAKMSTKSFLYKFLEPFIGKGGLFTSSGSYHKSQRKLLQPLFGPKVLEGYSHLFQKHATKFSNHLKSYTDKGSFDVLSLLHESAFETTMDIVAEDKNDHSIDYKYFPAYFRRGYEIFAIRTKSFWLYPDWLYKLTSYYKDQQETIKATTTFLEEVKNARLPGILKKLERKQDVDKVDDVRQPSMLEAMVQMVMDNPECLNEAEFKDHMLTFVATSQDTQSSAIAFTLMMLGMHPPIQCKVIEELNEVLGDKKCLDFSDVGKLKYMEMCIKEALRLFPLAPFLLRDVIEDFQLDNWTLPASCTVLFCIYQVHRNPDLWESPHDFYPEHFTAEAVAKRHLFAFLPFSAGPRRCIEINLTFSWQGSHGFLSTPFGSFDNCSIALRSGSSVGQSITEIFSVVPLVYWRSVANGTLYHCIQFAAQQFSYVNMKILLSTILQNYIVECEGSLEDLKIVMDVSIRPLEGYMIKIKNRECW